MAPSFDWPLSSLLCAEDNIDFLDTDLGENAELAETSSASSSLDHMNPQSKQSHDLMIHGQYSYTGVLCIHSDEWLDSMMRNESHHLPEGDYIERLQSGDVDLCGRRNAMYWIKKVHAYYGFGPLSLYLSVNYLDRFLSVYESQENKAWMMQLLAVACLSIAVKMEETEIPLTQDFQVAESEFVFEARTIQKMEILVLSTLRWRMHAVTPFSFVDSFLCRLSGNQPPEGTCLDKSVQLILSMVEDIDYLEFRPSEVAAAVTIGVMGKNQTQADFQTAITLLGLLASKERVVKVIELLHDLVLLVRVGYQRSDNSVHSPTGVLDAARLSYKSETSTDFDPCANSSTNTPNNKRRKVESGYKVQ